MCEKTGTGFKFGFKFPVGGSVPVILISNFHWGILNSSSIQQGGGGATMFKNVRVFTKWMALVHI